MTESTARVVPIKEASPPPPDIALKIELAQDIGGGQKVHFSTFTERDCDVAALRTVLDKMSGAADWLGAKYALRNLELQLEVEERALVDFRTQHETFLRKAETEWTDIQKRRGPVRLQGSQEATDSQFRNSINGRMAAIEKIRKDLAITKKIFESNG